MKKIFLFLLISYQVLSQNTDTPQGITIGDNTPSAIPLSVTKATNLSTHFSGLNPYLTFFEGNNFVGYFQNISGNLEIGTKNAANMTFYTGGVISGGFVGNTGTFYSYYPTTFNSLRAIGPLKTDYPATAGTFLQVLRSRGAGNTPIWSDFNYDPQIGFSAVRNTNYTITGYFPPATPPFAIIDGLTITFQDTPSTGMSTGGIYTAPSAGHYHFDVNIPYFEWTVGNQGSLNISMLKNNSEYFAGNAYLFGSFGSNTSRDGMKCSFDVDLAANDTIQFVIGLVSSVNIQIPSVSLLDYQKLRISGYKVY